MVVAPVVVLPVVVVAPVVVPCASCATFSRTLVPSGWVVPGAGSCATTVPAGRSDGTETRLASKPASRSVAVASDEVVPTTSGTVRSAACVVAAVVVAD